MDINGKSRARTGRRELGHAPAEVFRGLQVACRNRIGTLIDIGLNRPGF